METKRSAFGSGVITPLDRLFVRNNISPPSEDIVADPDAWKLQIEGVKDPTTLTVAELKNLGISSVAMVLQCSGNGRAYFPSNPSGTQWTVGAAGCVVFTGVPVKDVLAHVGGMDSSAKYMTGTGGEPIPEGLDANTIQVERSVPLEAIENAILAWEINGEPIPLAHGGPTEHSSAWEMPVKSWITYPGDPDESIKAGKVHIQGLAMGGTSDVTEVEVSVDGGKSWEKARFIGPDLGPFAWRQFVLAKDLKPGAYEITSRATNKAGQTQPKERMENNRGYLNNSWDDHMLTITIACAVCHTLDDAGTTGTIGPNLDELQPDADRIRKTMMEGMGAMPSFADSLSEDQREAVIEYVLTATGQN